MPRRPDGSWITCELADLREGYEISAHCMALRPDGWRCGHWAILDSEQLIRGLVEHFPLVLLKDRLAGVLKCTVCGSQEITLRLGSPSRRPGDRVVDVAPPAAVDQAGADHSATK